MSETRVYDLGIITMNYESAVMTQKIAGILLLCCGSFLA